jgi:hypothetical protein
MANYDGKRFRSRVLLDEDPCNSPRWAFLWRRPPIFAPNHRNLEATHFTASSAIWLGCLSRWSSIYGTSSFLQFLSSVAKLSSIYWTSTRSIKALRKFSLQPRRLTYRVPAGISSHSHLSHPDSLVLSTAVRLTFCWFLREDKSSRVSNLGTIPIP